MWKIEYNKEVRNYIYDSHPYTATIWQTIKTLRHAPNGLPNTDCTEISRNVFLWEVAGHIAIFERHLDEQKIVFTVPKPANGDN